MAQGEVLQAFIAAVSPETGELLSVRESERLNPDRFTGQAVGFEDMVNLAGEVRGPRRILSRGILLALGLPTVLYLAVDPNTAIVSNRKQFLLIY